MSAFRSALVQTLADLKEADVPDAVYELAFKMGLEVNLAGGTPPGAGAGATLAPRLPGAAAPTGSRLERIAGRLNIPVEVVGDVYDDSDGSINVIVGSGRLPRGTAAATKEIALLVAAGRQATGEEDWTPFSAIREACQTYGKLDSSNFATTLGSMQDVFGFRSPSARKREVRLNRPGWERAAELVASLGRGDQA